MKRAKRICAAVMLAGAMSFGMAATVGANTRDSVPPAVTANGQNLCEAFADAIEFLEGLPESRLRDFLLAQLRRISAAHCAG